MASSFGDVLLERVIDADPEALEGAPQHGPPFLGRELDGLHQYATAGRMREGGLAVRPQVATQPISP